MTSVGYVFAVISASLLHCSFAATGEAIMTVKLLEPILGDCSIMVYSSMPYVGMTPKQNGGHSKCAQMTRSKFVH